jgi:hypothetical protein
MNHHVNAIAGRQSLRPPQRRRIGTGRSNQREIREMMVLDYSSVSVSRKRYRVTADEDRKYLRLAERIESKLIQEKNI